MIKILYCIYVGIRSFHPNLPFIKANGLIAIAPLPADSIRPLAIRTFENWLDDVYLKSRARARNNPSRFTESEDYLPLPDPIYRTQSSGYAPTSGSLQNGTVQRSAPRNILTKARTPPAMDGSRANRGGTTALLLWPTLAIVKKILFVCPPPHDLRSIAEYLIVSHHRKKATIFWEHGSTSHHYVETNSIWIFILPTNTCYLTLLILMPNTTTHTNKNTNTIASTNQT